jgi:hypothetical protein
MDLITDLPRTSLGHDSIWVCVNRLSKMVHLKAIKKTGLFGLASGCAWLTGIDRHALHASVCEQARDACEAISKVELSRSLRLYLSILSKIFRLKDSLQSAWCRAQDISDGSHRAGHPKVSFGDFNIPLVARDGSWPWICYPDQQIRQVEFPLAEEFEKLATEIVRDAPAKALDIKRMEELFPATGLSFARHPREEAAFSHYLTQFEALARQCGGE